MPGPIEQGCDGETAPHDPVAAPLQLAVLPPRS
jgi:hypothetical protein